MIITLCASSDFFGYLPHISKLIEMQPGYTAYYPVKSDSARADMIRQHFNRIEIADAIYVLNPEKNRVDGYIGPNVFLEMGKAFDKKIPIFLKYPLPKQGWGIEEMVAMNPIVIGDDWGKMNAILRPHSREIELLPRLI